MPDDDPVTKAQSPLSSERLIDGVCDFKFPSSGVWMSGYYLYFSVRWDATRRAFAAMVSAGFVPPLDGKKDASTTYAFSRLCALLYLSSTLSRGLAPNRHVPQTCAIRWLFSACFKSMNLQGWSACVTSCRNRSMRSRSYGRTVYLIAMRAPRAASSCDGSETWLSR